VLDLCELAKVPRPSARSLARPHPIPRAQEQAPALNQAASAAARERRAPTVDAAKLEEARRAEEALMLEDREWRPPREIALLGKPKTHIKGV
jgi:hypothetical protein